MGGLNWEAANRRSRVYDGMGYQDMLDAAEERWAARELAREERIQSTRTGRNGNRPIGPLTKAERKGLNADARSLGMDLGLIDGLTLQQLFSGIGFEAQRLKIDVALLRRRRLKALRSGQSVKQILGAGTLDTPSGRKKASTQLPRTTRRVRTGPRMGGGPLPISTAERLRREAAATGRTVQQVAASGVTKSSPIVSRGAGKPPTRTASAQTPTQRPDSGKAAQAVAPVRAKPSKAERNRAAAARRNITVEQLIAERRATAARDLALAAEAKALGMTTKELRKQRAAEP